jgi:hypothetical protein
MLLIDTSTPIEEAQDRKALVNTTALNSLAPRQFRRLLMYKGKMMEKADALDFPSPLRKEDIRRSVQKVECKKSSHEFDEFHGQMFGRDGAYYIR